MRQLRSLVRVICEIQGGHASGSSDRSPNCARSSQRLCGAYKAGFESARTNNTLKYYRMVSDTLTTFALFASMILLALVSRRIRRNRPFLQTGTPACFAKAEDICQLLSPAQSLSHQLRARAIPNARLARAFEITNTFVSEDADVHKEFVRQARSLLSTVSRPNGLVCFAEQSALAVDTYLSDATPRLCAEYEPFVQYVTLATILTTLFGVAELPSSVDVLTVTRGINDLWRLSKTGRVTPAHMLDEINVRLRDWIPQHQNPLDFILPTFETMWRVVAITVAYTYNDTDARDAFAQFLANPTREQFEHFPEGAPSVDAIIAEAMRLHPPTRRIHRASVSTSNSTFSLHRIFPRSPRFEIADIGALHKDEDVWGADAGDFRPLRHHPESLTEEQKRALMPFGYGRLKCVASSWAPQGAALIVSTVLSRLGEMMEVKAGQTIGGREGWDGWRIETKASSD